MTAVDYCQAPNRVQLRPIRAAFKRGTEAGAAARHSDPSRDPSSGPFASCPARAAAPCTPCIGSGARSKPSPAMLTGEVTCAGPYEWTETPWSAFPQSSQPQVFASGRQRVG